MPIRRTIYLNDRTTSLLAGVLEDGSVSNRVNSIIDRFDSCMSRLRDELKTELGADNLKLIVDQVSPTWSRLDRASAILSDIRPAVEKSLGALAGAQPALAAKVPLVLSMITTLDPLQLLCLAELIEDAHPFR